MLLIASTLWFKSIRAARSADGSPAGLPGDRPKWLSALRPRFGGGVSEPPAEIEPAQVQSLADSAQLAAVAEGGDVSSGQEQAAAEGAPPADDEPRQARRLPARKAMDDTGTAARARQVATTDRSRARRWTRTFRTRKATNTEWTAEVTRRRVAANRTRQRWRTRPLGGERAAWGRAGPHPNGMG